MRGLIIIIIIIFDVWKGEMSVRGDVRRGKCPFPEHGSTGNYYSATSNEVAIRWPLMSGLLHLV